MRDNLREHRPRGLGRASTGAESSTRHQAEPTRRRTQPTTEDPYLRRSNSVNSTHTWLDDQADLDGSIQRTSSPIQEDYRYQEPQYEVRPATSRSQYRSTRHDRPVEDVRAYDDHYPRPENDSEGAPSSVRYTPPSSPDTAIHKRQPTVAERRERYELDDWHHEPIPEPRGYDPRDGGRREQISREKDLYYHDQGPQTYDNGVEVFHEPSRPDEIQYDERPRRASMPDDLESLDRHIDNYRAEQEYSTPARVPARKSRTSINSIDAGLIPTRGSPVDDRRYEYHDTHERNSKGSRDSRQTYEQSSIKYSKQDLGHENVARGSRYGVPTPPRTPVKQRYDYDREESPPLDDYQRRRGDYSPPQSISSYESHGSDHRAPARRTDDYDRPQASTRGAYESGRGDISPPVSNASEYYDGPERHLQSHQDYERSRSPSRRDRDTTRLRDQRADDRSPHRSPHDTDSSIESIKPRRSKPRSRGRSFAIVQLSSSESESESELEVEDDNRGRKYVGPPIRERDLYPSALARSQRRSRGSRKASGNSLFDMARSFIGPRGGSAMFVSLPRSSEAR